MNTQKQILLIVILFFTMVGGCAAYAAFDLPHRSVTQTKWTEEESVTRGALLFANNCRTCHGIKGQGGVGLQLNKDAFKDQSPLVLAANRNLIQRTLYCGRAGTLMPAWLKDNGGSLNAEQIVHLVDFLTSPIDPALKDDEGNPTNKGWLEAVEFGANLNRAQTALIGGDTLDTIARQHVIGYAELAKANPGISTTNFDAKLAAGTQLHVPAFKGEPNGYIYHVYKDNETIRKIAESQHVGAMILADLNNLPYKFTQGKDKADYTLQTDDGKTLPGLFPGDKLRLPDGAKYVVTAGDTVASIATQHGLQPVDVTGANQNTIGGLAGDAVVDHQRKLALPANAKAIVQTGQTTAIIATLHGLKAADLETLNSLAAGDTPAAGQALTLPPNTKYTIQTGDTLAKVAAMHGVTEDALASANGLKAGDPISGDVILNLPRIDAYLVKGQSLDDVAKTFSNVTADSLGKANGVAANLIIRIGTKLNVPADAWGSAPPDTKNNGTACVQNAVPQSVFQSLPGIGTAVATAVAPTAISKDVTLTSHSNDWTVTADGKAQDPNKGNVSVAKGTVVNFVNDTGLHTITINGKKDGDTFTQGSKRTITFGTAGQFKITCDFHPDMLAYINVQ